jgi:hypothetical protein
MNVAVFALVLALAATCALALLAGWLLGAPAPPGEEGTTRPGA